MVPEYLTTLLKGISRQLRRVPVYIFFKHGVAIRLKIKGDRVDDEANTSKYKITNGEGGGGGEGEEYHDRQETKRRLNPLETTDLAECVCVSAFLI